MAASRVDYTPRPFSAPRQMADSRTIGQLLGLQGQQQRENVLNRAQLAQQKWAQLGQVFSQFAQQARAEKEREAALAMRAEQQRIEQEKAARAEQFQREQFAAIQADREADNARQAAAAEAAQRNALAESTLPGVIAPETAEQLRPTGRVRVLDGAPVLMRTPQQARQAETDAAAAARAKADDDRQSARDKEIARHNQAMERASSARQSDGEPLVAVIGDDGQPVYLPRSQAQGRRPASNREQGRPVTSGDAGTIADFTTALDDIVAVRGVLAGSKATGAVAQAGAALPNAITELTGWGSTAKQKQATIDRVKQVIGKALEGGVLRKEDELKYAKILPTIGDTPEVVAAKLDGLEAAIKQRQQVKIDALADAGYDVERFRQRAPVSAAPDLSGIREGFSRTFRSGPFAGQEWAMVNGQPQRVK